MIQADTPDINPDIRDHTATMICLISLWYYSRTDFDHFKRLFETKKLDFLDNSNVNDGCDRFTSRIIKFDDTMYSLVKGYNKAKQQTVVRLGNTKTR